MIRTVDELEALLRETGHLATFTGHTDAAGAAFFLQVSARTLRNWAANDEGPPRREFSSGLKRYPLAGLLGWAHGATDGLTAARGEIKKIAEPRGKLDLALDRSSEQSSERRVGELKGARR